jgi:hypothetical protein
MQGAQNKRPPIKKRQSQNTRGSKQKASDKKRQPQNIRGSKQKTSDEKRGNPKTQGVQNKRPPIKKEATLKCNRLKTKDLR